MKYCGECGVKNDDAAKDCVHCGAHSFFAKPPRDKSAQQGKSTTSTTGASGKRDASSAIVFSCVACSASLRISLPVREGIYKCTNCKSAYRTIRASEPSVFFVLPEMDRGAYAKSAESRKSKRELPPEVKSALKIMGLDGEVSFEQIRQTYRELIKGYHPDKVSHLGSDLRKLAEAKTKDLNTAYKTLEKYYNA